MDKLTKGKNNWLRYVKIGKSSLCNKEIGKWETFPAKMKHEGLTYLHRAHTHG